MKSSFTEKEIRQIAELRKLVADILEDHFEQSDDFLISWIRYENHNTKKAEASIRRHKKWRKDMQLDKIHLEDTKQISEDIALELDLLDKEGYPLLALKLDKDVKSYITAEGGKERTMRYLLKSCEQAMSTIKKQHLITGGRVSQFSAVLDMEGFSYSQMTSTKVISLACEVARMGQENFPGLIKTLYVINAPRMAKVLLNILKPFLTADTVSRFKIFQGDKAQWRAALLEDIAPDQLPSFVNMNN